MSQDGREGGYTLAGNKKSKRERRMKVIIYLMILSMVLSTLLAGASFFL
ncbi:stressosome-associated protein Prli42 [Bacillus sp. SB49]|nr:stressosome-associated protein Prli42 [Bacillus sp. SB49]